MIRTSELCLKTKVISASATSAIMNFVKLRFLEHEKEFKADIWSEYSLWGTSKPPNNYEGQTRTELGNGQVFSRKKYKGRK